MKKSELIEMLQNIEGDPDVYIDQGNIYSVEYVDVDSDGDIILGT